MQEKARIIEINGAVVSVVPLDVEACIGCTNADCKKNGNVFQAFNRKNFPLTIGSEVRIVAPMRRQLWQAFRFIGIPVILAVAAYISVSKFASSAFEGFRVGAALVALFCGMALMYFSRHSDSENLPEVAEVL